MIEYYYLFFLLIPSLGYYKYKKYINTFFKTIWVMYCCPPTSHFIHKIDNNIYQLNFKINNKQYSTRLKINNGPDHIEKISHDDKDITHIIEPYYNFSNITIVSPITPNMLGYSEIHIDYFNGDTHLYQSDDNILNLLDI